MKGKLKVLIQIFVTHKVYTRAIKTYLFDFYTITTYQMPPLFIEGKCDKEGEMVLRPKSEWRAKFLIVMDPMLVDIYLDKVVMLRKLDS